MGALQPVLANLGLRGVHSNVEIAGGAEHVADGIFTPTDRHERALTARLAELASRRGYRASRSRVVATTMASSRFVTPSLR
ncbi:hypothetical protein N1027_05480 [Herbiconiux sp. CPCC 205763]|uniref:Uncharacterized protein n=1 Tax=Herbiconiux aconitum TaxID=2970913 RepID=A0ABT2GRZ8_9MICO|nr:hypothetical protein [Herbiconiux aconitum]MCS5717586.1 hypothetical protein [Herbiconiux aconitum]